MASAAMQRRPSDEPGTVPFTRSSLDVLRALMVRFHDLQRPLPEYSIIELALQRLYNEYCLVGHEIQATDPASMRLLKKNSREVLNARYREYMELETVILRKRRTA
jgi:hypothetical protein